MLYYLISYPFKKSCKKNYFSFLGKPLEIGFLPRFPNLLTAPFRQVKLTLQRNLKILLRQGMILRLRVK
jgi:hypothetical protein